MEVVPQPEASRSFLSLLDAAVSSEEMEERKLSSAGPSENPIADANAGDADGSTSDATTSENSAGEDAVVVVVTKKRKGTYYARKDEMKELLAELQVLRAQLQEKESVRTSEFKPLVNSLTMNASLRATITQNGLAVATAQSLLTRVAAEPSFVPFGSYIHLARDAQQRSETLASLKAPKLRAAAAYILARRQHADLRRQFMQSEVFEMDNGDYKVVNWQGTRFERVRSVRQVYDAMLYFLKNQEISVSENLGIVVIRESEDDDQVTSITQVRMLCKEHNDLDVETNIVTYTEFNERSDLLDEPHGVTVFDFVDRDDLYPRQPHTRVRKDISAAILLSACPSSDTDTANSQGEMTVSFSRAVYVHVHNSKVDPGMSMLQLTYENVGRWCDVMVKVMREQLACQRFLDQQQAQSSEAQSRATEHAVGTSASHDAA